MLVPNEPPDALKSVPGISKYIISCDIQDVL